MNDYLKQWWPVWLAFLVFFVLLWFVITSESSNISKEYANVSVYGERCGFRTYHDKDHRVSVTQELTDKELKCIIVLSK